MLIIVINLVMLFMLVLMVMVKVLMLVHLSGRPSCWAAMISTILDVTSINISIICIIIININQLCNITVANIIMFSS